MNRLEIVTRLQDHIEDESIPESARETCRGVLEQFRKLKWDTGFWPAPTLNLVPQAKFDNAEPPIPEDSAFAKALACLVLDRGAPS